MFSQRKTKVYPTVMPSYGNSKYGMSRKKKLFGIDEPRCCSDVEVLVCKAVKNVQVLEAEKKSAWTGLDQVDFEKISSKSQCPNRKIGVDRSRQK